jgi:hypothetical protein
VCGTPYWGLHLSCTTPTLAPAELAPRFLGEVCSRDIMNRKSLSRERIRFYPKSPDQPVLILAIKGHFSDRWERL